MTLKTINTKYGKASLNTDGHYKLCKTNESLHRKIWESHYGKKIPEGYDIHHIDGNKTNNEIWNLQCVEHGKHSQYHHLKNGRCRPNKTGYYRVRKVKRKVGKRGFAYVYRENKKEVMIQRANLYELEKVVKGRGLPWFKVGKVKANDKY